MALQSSPSSSLHDLALAQAGLVSFRQLQTLGYQRDFARRQVDRQEWNRVVRGVYAVTPKHRWSDQHQIRRLQSAWAGLLAIPGSIAVGTSALALHGVWGLPQTFQPEVVLPDGASRKGPAGVRVRRYRGFSYATQNGFSVALLPDALIQALPSLNRATGVSVLDSALNLGKIDADDLSSIYARARNHPGASRIRNRISLADGRAQSPFETRARLQCLDAGLPPPTLQAKVHDWQGNTVAHGDLGWLRGDGTWVLVDLDGRKYHSSPKAVLIDRRRQNSIALSAGHIHLRFSWEDLRLGVIPSLVAQALALPSNLASVTTGV